MPYLERIWVYPVKALDPLHVLSAAFTQRGALAQDREFAFVDADGRFINGKRVEAIHAIRSGFDLESRTLTLAKNDSPKVSSFSLLKQAQDAEAWMSNYLGYAVRLLRNEDLGFPDDSEAWGPTVISTATLETVASWFPGLSLESVRRRFRANLEIGGVEAFWEERLYSEKGKVVTFHIGAVTLHGVNPCQRCIVPTRDPDCAERYPDFQKIFQEKRRASLPAWANAGRFDHFYRLAINTRVNPDQHGRKIRLGDQVRLENP